MKPNSMNSVKINKEFLPQRCEICHQEDKFNPINNDCERCKNLNCKMLLNSFRDFNKTIPIKFSNLINFERNYFIAKQETILRISIFFSIEILFLGLFLFLIFLEKYYFHIPSWFGTILIILSLPALVPPLIILGTIDSYKIGPLEQIEIIFVIECTITILLWKYYYLKKTKERA